MRTLDEAVSAVSDGELVVYPTETVYGLGGDALDAEVVDRVFAAKDRPRSNPMAFATATVSQAAAHVSLTERTRRFMAAFLPGPVTVICDRGASVPDRLVAGGDRVGVRVPDQPTARALLERTGPITATSANVSGEPAPRSVAELDDAIDRAAAVVLDGGRTPGGASTVVDVDRGEIHRRGRHAEQVANWLAEAA